MTFEQILVATLLAPLIIGGWVSLIAMFVILWKFLLDDPWDI